MNFKSFVSTSFAVRMSAVDLSMTVKLNQYEIRSTGSKSLRRMMSFSMAFDKLACFLSSTPNHQRFYAHITLALRFLAIKFVEDFSNTA